MAHSKITIRDVAKKAGVSISSVSRVFNNHPHISEELRLQIEDASRQLGYRPTPLAQSLRSGTTHSIGFLVGPVTNPAVPRIFISASEVLMTHGYATLMASSQNNPQLDVAYLHFLAERQVDGLIVSSAAGGPDQAGPVITELGIPTVILDRPLPAGNHVSAVHADHVGGMRAAVKHLLELGHQRIGLIGGPDYFYLARIRAEAYRATLKDANVLFDPGLLRSIVIDEAAAYAEALSLLHMDRPPTAVIAAGNIILVGILQALHECDVGIGRDMAVVNCDDIDLARLYNPPITAIARDLGLMGKSAAHLLLESIRTGDHRVMSIPTKLLVRESTMT